jgi:acylphosphatase
MRRIRIQVYGKVQGVFYRQSTQAKARELGLQGWVENLPDGSVQLEAEGPEKKLEALTSWCKQGPAAAIVERIELEEINPTGAKEGFYVRKV